MDVAKFNIESGKEFPYNGRLPVDKAEEAALGILCDLCDRRGIKQELRNVDTDVREEIVCALADIIREVYGE